MKRIRKLAVVIAAVLLVCMNFAFTFQGLTSLSSGDYPHTFTITYYGDQTGRGFTWLTGTDYPDGVAYIAEDIDGESNFNDAVELEVRSNPISGQGSYSSQKAVVHKAEIEDLEYGKTYRYRVGALNVPDDKFIEGAFTVRTDDDFVENGLTFLHVTDTQQGSKQDYEKNWNVAMKSAYKNLSPDFVLHTGDVTDNNWSGKSNILEFHWTHDILNEHGDLPIIMASTGNHDMQNDVFNNFYNYKLPENASTQTGVYYSYDLGNVHFINIDTNQTGFNSPNPLKQEQMDWLTADLQSTDADFIIIQTHKGPYSYGKHYDDDEMPYLRRQLMPLLDKYEVDLFLNGHDHIYSRSQPLVWDEQAQKAQVKDAYAYDEENAVYEKEGDGTIHITLVATGGKREILPYPGWVTSDQGHFSQSDIDYLDSLMATNTLTGNAAHDTFISSAHNGEMDKYCMFGAVTVKGGNLQYDVYIVNRNNGDMELYDSFSIAKEISYQTESIKEVNDVIAMIDALKPDAITMASEPQILAARAAYNALDEEQKKAVTNYLNLLSCENKLKMLQNAKNDKGGCGKASASLSAIIAGLVCAVVALKIKLPA